MLKMLLKKWMTDNFKLVSKIEVMVLFLMDPAEMVKLKKLCKKENLK